LWEPRSEGKDEAAFDIHADLPHTVRFVEKMQPLIDHAFEVTRAEPLR
jgi:quinol monooxygenase YgiN